MIFASLRLTKRQAMGLLIFNLVIGLDQVWTIKLKGVQTWNKGKSLFLDEFEEITNISDPLLKKIRDKAPSLVQALIAKPCSGRWPTCPGAI